MDATSLVSLLTPCYNHEAYLGEYFESLLAQTHPDIELVFVDDCSTDDSWAIAQAWEERLRRRLPRLRLLRNDENLGLARTLDRAAEGIGGEFVAILESDDVIYPEKVRRGVERLTEQPGLDAVHSEVDFLYEPEGRLEHRHWASLGKPIPTGDVFHDLLWENHVLTCTFSCRRHAFERAADFERYRGAGYRTVDYPLFLDMARRHSFGYIDESLARYRVVEGSISHPRDLERQFAWKRAYYQTKLDYIARYDAPEATRERAERQLHQTLYEFGWRLREPEPFNRGLDWLRTYRPAAVASPLHRLRRAVIGSSWMSRALRRLESALAPSR